MEVSPIKSTELGTRQNPVIQLIVNALFNNYTVVVRNHALFKTKPLTPLVITINQLIKPLHSTGYMYTLVMIS